MPRSPVWPWMVAIATVALGPPAVVLDALAGSHGDGWWVSAAYAACVLSSTALGLLLAIRRPGHPVAWLLQANGFVLALAGLAGSWADYAVLEDPGALPAGRFAALWDSSMWPLLFVPITAIAYVFPDGRLPSPAWRRPVTVAGAAVAGLLVATLFRDEPLDSPFEHVVSPLPHLPAAITGPLSAIGLLGLLGFLLGGAWALRARFRRAMGIERLQLKWLAYAACLIPLTFAICMTGSLLAGDGESAALGIALVAMMVGVPLAVAVAILRYRLYDIDRLVNRTAVYAILTVLLGGAYAALALGLGVAAGGRSALTTAVATLAVAIAFRPLRAWVQDGVDQRFNRARYDGLRRVERFLDDLPGRAAPEEVEGVLAAALGDARLEVRYWLADGEPYVDAHGRPVADDQADGRARAPVLRAGAPLAVVVHDPALDERPDLRASIIEAAGLAIEIARLRVELRRRLDEVSASRARIVAAGDEERRRIERDLHDGAQQRLVSVGLALRHVQHELGGSANGTGPALDGAVDQIAQAIAELRELARGVRPAQLDDGLAPALRELGARAPLPVEVNASPERFPPGVEAAAYFVACEALTNAAKHAAASRVVVRSTREEGRLVVRVSDDGAGGARAGHGSGLTGLADRVQAHGGTLTVDSPPGRGTTLTAEFPCGS